jgi:hypothetical protein
VTSPTSPPSPDPLRPKRRGRRALWWVLGSIAAVLLLAAGGILVWSQVGVMAAEPEPLAAVRADPAIEITDTAEAIVLSPAGTEPDTGLVFIPGAKVDPWAYANNLAGLVAQGDVAVVITKPWLNLAFFDLRPLSAFTDLVPEVGTWAVGGHSLGGVRACQLADDANALVLLGSYCASDLADSGLPVLSIAGSEDGLSTPEKIADARPLLPADADMQVIDGASHASFGDYGPQAGDGTPTIDDAEMDAALTPLLLAFAAGLATP